MNVQHLPPNKTGPSAEGRKPSAESGAPNAGLHGVLVVDKPQGPTSHDVVAVARRSLRERRIGHTGTLDPMATGVLPLVIGKATRLSALLSSDEKTYEAAVRLGGSTATYDAAERLALGGAPPPAPDVHLSAIEAVLARFRGTFDQVPPPFSAKKLAGTPAYKLARQDQSPELSAVRVTVHTLELLHYEGGLLQLRLQTSSGFYVRSLAHDIGVALGCGAHLEGLRRTRAGTFRIEEAVTLSDLSEFSDVASRRLIPLDELLPDVPIATLTPSGVQKASHGNTLNPSDVVTMASHPIEGESATGRDGALVRLFDPTGGLIGMARASGGGLLRPYIVLM